MPKRKDSYYKRLEIAAKGAKSHAESCKRRRESEVEQPVAVVDIGEGESVGVGERECVGETSTSSSKTSAEKRKSFFEKEPENVSERKRILVYEDSLHNLVSKFICKGCYSENVSVKLVGHQIDTYVNAICDNCGYIYKEETSVKVKGFHPCTTLVVWCFLLLGIGYDGVEKVISALNLRHFTHPTYVRYAKYITKCAVEKTERMLGESREAVRKYFDKKPGEVVETDVTFDGSWHRRGHKSNYGIGAVIEADTGLILDYQALSKFCLKCTQNENKLLRGKITHSQYVGWLDEHYSSSETCDINFDGTSSGAMEAESAVTMWGRSEKHFMQYRTFITDGDSSAFKSVTEMGNGTGPYGKEKPVAKAECVNHVAKRLGTSLRNIKRTRTMDDDSDSGEPSKKKSRPTSMGGRHKLTDTVIDHLQYYFSVSLKRKVGTTASAMRDEILSSFHHCTSTDAKPKHHLCTKGPNSWCFYNKHLALGKKPPNHKKMKVYFHLTVRQLEKVKAIYDRLTTDEMMERCLKGMTQNRNESLHSRIWKMCPKHKNTSRMYVEFATATAVGHYNCGYERSNLCDVLGIEVPSEFMKYLKRKDKVMDAPIKIKMRNKRLRRDIEFYAAGAF